LVIKTLDSELDPDPEPQLGKMLDPDPHYINANPQSWTQKGTGTRIRNKKLKYFKPQKIRLRPKHGAWCSMA
jgi:hypothetical protein